MAEKLCDVKKNTEQPIKKIRLFAYSEANDRTQGGLAFNYDDFSNYSKIRYSNPSGNAQLQSVYLQNLTNNVLQTISTSWQDITTGAGGIKSGSGDILLAMLIQTPTQYWVDVEFQ